MLQPASERTVRAGFGLALISALGIVSLAIGWRVGLYGWVVFGSSLLGLGTMVVGIAGAAVTARIAVGEAQLTRLNAVVASVIAAIGWYHGLSFALTYANWAGIDTLEWCEGPCPPTDAEIAFALLHAVVAIVVVATAIATATVAKNATPRERIRIALLVIVASTPVANLLVFTATSPHNSSPSAASAPVG